MGKKNDMYNEITRLKEENEKLTARLAALLAANSSGDPAPEQEQEQQPQEPNQEPEQPKLSEEDQKTIDLAKRYASKLGLDASDIEAMVKEMSVAKKDDKERFSKTIEAKVLHQNATDRLALITSMELAGKSPKEILNALYKDEESQPKEQRESSFMEKLSAKLRLSLQQPYSY
jgi:pyruvate/2-oxoglutarate dehydrogenase complex dihydrolipoamide acyltransferase (E2) component